jgi:hypothetical protein
MGSVVLHPSADSTGLLDSLWVDEQQLLLGGDHPGEALEVAEQQQVAAECAEAQPHHQEDNLQLDEQDLQLSTTTYEQQKQQEPAEVLIQQHQQEVLQPQLDTSAAAAEAHDGVVAANGASHTAGQPDSVSPVKVGQDVPAAGAAGSVALVECGSWDPLNAASEPPAAARVEGGSAGPSKAGGCE